VTKCIRQCENSILGGHLTAADAVSDQQQGGSTHWMVQIKMMVLGPIRMGTETQTREPIAFPAGLLWHTSSPMNHRAFASGLLKCYKYHLPIYPSVEHIPWEQQNLVWMIQRVEALHYINPSDRHATDHCRLTRQYSRLEAGIHARLNHLS
jgi:hypothetical protein